MKVKIVIKNILSLCDINGIDIRMRKKWQNGYNHPWRIRPIYMLNLRTGLAQHITGGMQHWLFDKAVLEDLFE